MKKQQYFGYNGQEEKVTAHNTSLLRRRGALGQMFFERDIFEGGEWITEIQAVGELGFLSNPMCAIQR